MVGRSLSFDKLLADHRAAKDELLRHKMSVKLGVGSPGVLVTQDLQHSTPATNYKSLPSPAATSPSNSSSDILMLADVEPATSPRDSESLPSPPMTKSSWRSAWKARCAVLRSARLFRILAPSRFASPADDWPIKRFDRL